MKITALEIKQHEFEKSFRGYNIEEVDIFLSNLAQEWERLTNDSKMLKMQLDIAEKEASKLREVEMTLIKTLRTAEDTSSRITENAKLEADRKIENAQDEANKILEDARHQSKVLIEDAEQKAASISVTAKNEFRDLENQFVELETFKKSILNQLKEIANGTIERVGIFEKNDFAGVPAIPKVVTPETIVQKETFAPVVEEAEEEVAPVQEIEVEEEIISVGSFSSSANEIISEPEPVVNQDLEIIEGIGPKIKELLNASGIKSFRDLAYTPVYRIKDILEAAGPHFAMHDPTTWVEQAMLAETGKWEQLETLKAQLIAGRKANEEPVKVQEKAAPAEEKTAESSTEEMLDKVNKVKAAIRKAMTEKNEKAEPEVVVPKSINDVIAEKKQGGSFFDNFN